MQVREIMYHKLLHTKPFACVDEAADEMDRLNIGSLIVMEGDKPIGIVTIRDIIRKVVARDRLPDSVHVHEIMSAPVHAVDASADVQEAADKMNALNISRLLVTDDGRPVGMFSAKLLAKNLRFLRPQKAIGQYLDTRVAHLFANR